MKNIVVLLAVLAVLVLVTPVFAQQDDVAPDVIEYIVTGETANLRAGAGTGFDSVGTVKAGDSVLIYSETPDVRGWFRVYREGEDDAYIADFLVERAPMRFYAAAQEPVAVIEGVGASLSDVIELPTGAYRLDATVNDNAFILKAIPVEGDCSEGSLLNEFGFDISRMVVSTIYISSGCSVLFEADNVDKAWTIEVRNILDEDFFGETLVDAAETGGIQATGHTLTMPIFFDEGVWSIQALVEDNAFITRAYAVVGECTDETVFNEFGDGDTLELESALRVDEGGCIFILEIYNVEKSWELIFEKLG